MYPRNGFIDVEQTRQGADPRSAGFKVDGVDACAVAFLPSREIHACGLTDLDEDLEGPVASLLAEGTEAPPKSFDGPADFMSFLRGGSHRGALGICSPSAQLDREERVVGVRFRMTSGGVGAGYVRRASGTTMGVGAATDKRRHRVTFGDRFVRIDLWQRFVMGFAGDLHGRFPGGDVAPLGWVMLTYFLHADGGSQAYCASSYLPSVWFYRDYIRTFRREIEDANGAEAEAVLRPQPDAPTGSRWACLDVSTGFINAVAG